MTTTGKTLDLDLIRESVTIVNGLNELINKCYKELSQTKDADRIKLLHDTIIYIIRIRTKYYKIAMTKVIRNENGSLNLLNEN